MRVDHQKQHCPNNETENEMKFWESLFDDENRDDEMAAKTLFDWSMNNSITVEWAPRPSFHHPNDADDLCSSIQYVQNDGMDIDFDTDEFFLPDPVEEILEKTKIYEEEK